MEQTELSLRNSFSQNQTRIYLSSEISIFVSLKTKPTLIPNTHPALLLSEEFYEIIDNSGGLDVTNIGAANNNVGTQFTASGTTPTSWGTGTLEDINLPYEVVTPWAHTDLNTLQYTWSNDTIFFVHGDYYPRVLVRNGERDWTLSEFDNTDGPYEDPDLTDTKLWLTSISDTMTLTSDQNDFAGSDVNKFVEVVLNGKTVVVKVTANVSATVNTVQPVQNVVDFEELDSRANLEYASASGSFPNRIRSQLAIWNRSSENSYIRVDGTWRYTGSHASQPEVVTPAWGNDYSTDVIQVSSTPTMVSTSGNLSLDNASVTATLNASKDIFLSSDVGRHIRLSFNGKWVWCKITAYTSARVVSVEAGSSIPLDPNDPSEYRANAETYLWRWGYWKSGRYPKAIGFHEERLWFARGQWLWGTKPGDFYNFAPTDQDGAVLDDSAITYELASGKYNEIIWIESGPVLLIGTAGEEYQSRAASSIDQPITATDFTIKPQTGHGSYENSQAIRIGHTVSFIHRSKRKIQELSYNFELNGWIARDLTVLSEHVPKDAGGMIEFDYQEEPDQILWSVLNNGDFAGLTLDREQQVAAWHRHRLAGDTARVMSLAIVPSTETTTISGFLGTTFTSTDGNSGDAVYLVVKRKVNSVTVQMIEKLEFEYYPLAVNDKDKMLFLDCHITRFPTGWPTGPFAPISSLSGLDHLNGESVDVVVDFSYIGKKTVSAGAIDISDHPGNVVFVGYQYDAEMSPLPFEGSSRAGTTHGKKQKLSHLSVRLLNSINFHYGPALDNLIKEDFRTPQDDLNDDIDLFTGVKRIKPLSRWDRDSRIFIVSKDPYPLTILSIMPEHESS
jgi:hypothetical protein